MSRGTRAPEPRRYATVPILGMVAADATEMHVAGYLRSVAHERGWPAGEPLGARPAAIGLWHIAKAALVRDFAERVLRGDVPANTPTPDRFSHWVAQRLLSPDELAQFEAEDEEDEEDAK